MGLFKNLQLLTIKLVCWLGWLLSFASAQLDISEGVTGFVNIPALGLTCAGNLAAFVTSLIRGRLDLELGAKDALDTLASRKLKNIEGIKHGNGLTTCTEDPQTASGVGRKVFRWLRHRLGINVLCFREEDFQIASTGGGDLQTVAEESRRQTTPTEGEVPLQIASTEERGLQILFTEGEDLQTAPTKKVSLQNVSVVMLSNNIANSSIREFMKFNAPIVDSIFLQFLSLQDAINDASVELASDVTIEMCQCCSCDCIVFWTVEEISIMLALRIPGTLKLFSNSLCLLPCLTCLKNGCHGCKEGLLHVEGPLPMEQADEGYRWRESDSKVVSEILNDINARSIKAEEHICICIPMHGASSDVWTELLIRSLRSKDAEGRGVRVMASEALEGYLVGRRGGTKESVEYNTVPFITPRLTEVLINVVLTFWFGVDGFSSSLAARRTIRDYLVDSKGSGFAANAFLTKAVVKSDFNNTQVCQVLTFRSNRLSIKTLSFVVGCVNFICFIVWTVFICSESDISPSLSRARSLAIAVGIFITMLMNVGIVVTQHSMKSGLRFLCLFIYIFSVPAGLFFAPPLNIVMLYTICAVLIMVSWYNWYEKAFLMMIYLDMAGVSVLFTMVFDRLPDENYYRWVYGALQIMVWVKWASGSYILTTKNSLEFFGKSPHTWGTVAYSSAFFLNAVLAGVRCNWGHWPWRNLFRKI